MGDLGEPPGSAGFRVEGVTGVVILVWMLRSLVLDLLAVEVRKLDRLFLLANAVNPAVVITFPVVHNKKTCYLLK